MTVKENLVTLTFSHAENGLTTFGKELYQFKIAGKDLVGTLNNQMSKTNKYK